MPTATKRLGSYLVEAGLITPAQIDVALNDQKMMNDLRFGEVLVTRGWIKQQTLDYLIKKVVEPERQALRQDQQMPTPRSQPLSSTPLAPPPPIGQAPANERKSRPAVPPDDDDVGWVG
jgi:hypothetical protein